MFNIMKDVINNGNFELSKILSKIDKQWAEDKLTDDERVELINSAQGKANVKNSIDMYDKVLELDKRLKVAEDLIIELSNLIKNSVVEDDTTSTPTNETPVEPITYPEFKIGKWYYNGDIVSHNNQNYKCIAPLGVVCVWSPTDYSPFWELLVDEVIEEEISVENAETDDTDIDEVETESVETTTDGTE